MRTSSLRSYAAICLTVLIFAVTTSAQTAPSGLPNVKIENFGQMDERFYRGAQPQPEDFQQLRDLGVKTVINLRNDPVDYEERAVEDLGMNYIHIPMSGWKYPKDRQLEEFVKLAQNPETGVFFVHCKAGIHRTGVAGAVYRFTKYGWDYDLAYQEMKNYRFYTGWFHGALKSYVKDYAVRLKAQQLNVTQTNAASTL